MKIIFFWFKFKIKTSGEIFWVKFKIFKEQKIFDIIKNYQGYQDKNKKDNNENNRQNNNKQDANNNNQDNANKNDNINNNHSDSDKFLIYEKENSEYKNYSAKFYRDNSMTMSLNSNDINNELIVSENSNNNLKSFGVSNISSGNTIKLILDENFNQNGK